MFFSPTRPRNTNCFFCIISCISCLLHDCGIRALSIHDCVLASVDSKTKSHLDHYCWRWTHCTMQVLWWVYWLWCLPKITLSTIWTAWKTACEKIIRLLINRHSTAPDLFFQCLLFLPGDLFSLLHSSRQASSGRVCDCVCWHWSHPEW